MYLFLEDKSYLTRGCGLKEYPKLDCDSGTSATRDLQIEMSTTCERRRLHENRHNARAPLTITQSDGERIQHTKVTDRGRVFNDWERTVGSLEC